MPMLSPLVEPDVLGKSEHSSTKPHMTIGGNGPHRLARALAMWLSIYPALTLALWLFEHLGLSQLALPLRRDAPSSHRVLSPPVAPATYHVPIPPGRPIRQPPRATRTGRADSQGGSTSEARIARGRQHPAAWSAADRA